jgi:hypothetical protein
MRVLPRWMTRLLRFAGTFNLVAGACIVCLYRLGFYLLDLADAPPGAGMTAQMMGFFVMLFGAGYHWTASHPIENKNILVLGCWSKALGSLLGLGYAALGWLPWWFALVVLAADTVYVPPFLMILRRIGQESPTVAC